ncbi:DUF1963 domain-containing protein [Nocardioides sp. 616]|uniref:YwqG family protein n=1 Tax=Nocardioides sp. 616 TaxID=2268090 RepID=UPI0013B3B1B6|nr:DUF1963 domain-containing protein [Nocardioides sp. 616]
MLGRLFGRSSTKSAREATAAESDGAGHLARVERLIALAPPEDRDSVRALLRPAAVSHGTSGRPAAVDSYIGGHPYLPAGREWPLDEDGRPMHFVLQVNFAAVPQLPDFPGEGLLQFFVRDHETWGLTFAELMGREGFHCRWYAASDLDAATSPDPSSPVPPAQVRPSPVEHPGPWPFAFELLELLPSAYEQMESERAANPRGFAAYEALWEEHEEVAEAASEGGEVQVGGWSAFLQGAPDAPEGCSPRLILGLASAGGMMWGDVGTAHLFGDPAALARGDVSDFWWEWSH